MEWLSRCIDAGRGGWIVTVNLDHWRMFRSDPAYASLCRKADLRVADGMPLVWASRLQGTPLPERVTGADLLWTLSSEASRRGFTIFLLGGDPGTAAATSGELQRRFENLRVVGWEVPEVGWMERPRDRERIFEAVCRFSPDIVFVALGKPQQDQCIAALRERLPRSWMVGVGISFSFASGRLRRAPHWMQAIGLEWLFRLGQEPRRLTSRYAKLLLPGLQLLAGALWSRWGAGRGGVREQ